MSGAMGSATRPTPVRKRGPIKIFTDEWLHGNVTAAGTVNTSFGCSACVNRRATDDEKAP